MFKLERALKTYREAGALNAQVNLFGFIDDHTFLTKGGDVGLILAVSGVDYECLASAEVDSYTKRLESPSKSSMSPAMPHGVTKSIRPVVALSKQVHVRTLEASLVVAGCKARVVWRQSEANLLFSPSHPDQRQMPRSVDSPSRARPQV